MKVLKRELFLYCAFSLLSSSPTFAQSDSFLDSANKYRPQNPAQALVFSKKALLAPLTELKKGKALLLTGALFSDLSRYDSAHVVLNQALKIFEGLPDSVLVSETFENIGIAFEFQSNYSQALENYQSAYGIRKKLNLKKDQAYSLNSIGNIEVLLNKYPEALAHFYEALRLGKETGDEQVVVNAYNNIGMVYDYTNDLDKALEYYEKAKTGFAQFRNQSGLSGALNNIGLVYKNKGEPAKAIPLYLEALEIYTKLNSLFGIAALQNNLGVAYSMTNNLDKALEYHQKALATNTSISNFDGVSNSHNSIAECYMKLNQNQSAIDHYRQGLSIASRIKSKDRMAESYEGLSKASERLHDYKKSLEYFREAKILRDSILTAEKFQKLFEMEQKYESALKERQIALLNVESEKQKLAIMQQKELISKQNTQLLLIIITVSMLALVVYLFYSRLTVMQKAKLQILENEKDQAVIRSVYEQRISISKDMHDEIGSGLTHIAMVSELISSVKKEPPELKKDVEMISEISRKLIQSMSEIIWAINPQNETLDNLISYLREQTNKEFEPFQVAYTINTPEIIPEMKLSNIQRRNLFLVTKETLNNALKHSGASSITLSICIEKSSLKFSVRDDGKGFDSANIRRSANGLKNMKSRMEEIHGFFDIRSSDGGTTTTYSMPLPMN